MVKITPPKILSFSSNLKPEIQKAADAAGVDYDTAEEVLYSFFRLIYIFLSDPRFPHVTIYGFFKIHSTPGLIRRYILNGFKEFRSNPSIKSKTSLIDRIIKTWRVRNRLILANDYIRDGYKWPGCAKVNFLKEDKKIMLGENHGLYYKKYGKIIRPRRSRSKKINKNNGYNEDED